MAAIYLLTCDKNLHYVGVSTNPKHRITSHLSGNGSRLVKEALLIGASFTSSILLENDDVRSLYLLEPDFIKDYNSIAPFGYNLDKGGSQGGISVRLGEKNSQAILTEEIVLEIRTAFCYNKVPQGELAKLYGVSRENISAIVVGKSWKHVGGPRSQIRKPRAVTEQDELLFKKARLEGLTYQEIADRYNRSPATIRKYCLK